MGEKLKLAFAKLGSLVDVRDFLVFGGLAVMGYGLWMLRPWVSLTVVGGIFFIMGFFPRLWTSR